MWVMSLIKMINSKGPKWDSYGTPEVTKIGSERAPFSLTIWDLCER